MRQEHDTSIRSGIVHPIVLAIGTCVVACTRENCVGHAPQPGININDVFETLFESRAALAKLFIIGDDGCKFVRFPIILLQEKPPVFLLIVAEVADVDASNPVGVWQLKGLSSESDTWRCRSARGLLEIRKVLIRLIYRYPRSNLSPRSKCGFTTFQKARCDSV